MTIQPIETRYAGCRFRSRLEARWAVFFDHLGITWEYEPQGFDLPSGRYLPDFLISGLGGDARDGHLWFEVKPHRVSTDPTRFMDRQDARWAEIAQMTGRPIVVAFGMPRSDRDFAHDPDHPDGWMELYSEGGWDNHHTFATCPMCGRLGVTFEGRGPRICWHDPNASDRVCTDDDPRIVAAYEAARSARFEHGESG